MSTFTLTNVATDIDSAISRVTSADTTPTNNSQSMVTSGGVKAALDNISTGVVNDLTPMLQRINAISQPPLMMFNHYHSFPLAQSQENIVFEYVTTSTNSKYNTQITMVVHVFDVDGNQITANNAPVATHTAGGNISGTFTGTVSLTQVGWFKYGHTFTHTASNSLTGVTVNITVQKANPTLTNPLPV